jgi:predicted ATPase
MRSYRIRFETASEDGRSLLAAEFERIFAGILKGRRLAGAGIGTQGLLSIKIEDLDSGRSFDIDGLSSGEKGLVLTFLLIGRNAEQNGIILLDEPELHLNPAVSNTLLPFLLSEYVNPRSLQVIICSHSPEVLASAFEKDECTLYHLVSGSLITKVRRNDIEEVSDAFRRLGTSESEGLLYRGTIFVEGEHDAEILETGFPSIL